MSESTPETEASTSATDGVVGGDPGEGLFANQAFSIEMVLRNGLGLLRERAAFVFGGAFAVFAAQLAPSVIAIPFNVFVGLQGDIDPTTAQAVSNGIQLVLMLLFFPIQVLLNAGYVNALGRYVAGEDLAWGLLVTSVKPAVRLLLYRIVTWFVMLAVGALLVGPAILLTAGWAQGSVPGAAVGLAWIALGGAYIVAWLYLFLGLELGAYAVVLDGVGPIEAINRSWTAASGARVTLLVMNVVFFVPWAISAAMVYCLVGVVLLPLVWGVWEGGLLASWLLYGRPEPRTREWPFYQRNPTPYV